MKSLNIRKFVVQKLIPAKLICKACKLLVVIPTQSQDDCDLLCYECNINESKQIDNSVQQEIERNQKIFACFCSMETYYFRDLTEHTKTCQAFIKKAADELPIYAETKLPRKDVFLAEMITKAVEAKLMIRKQENSRAMDQRFKAAEQLALNNLKQINTANEDRTKLTRKKLKADYDSKIADIDLKLILHENSTTDGTIIWKIDDYNDRFAKATMNHLNPKKNTAIHSTPCFTDKFGYKYCLSLYVNGDGLGKGTHMSLFIVIMRGDYDDLLQWPFTKKITFTLIDQKDRKKRPQRSYVC